jgi:hypothetical protein
VNARIIIKSAVMAAMALGPRAVAAQTVIGLPNTTTTTTLTASVSEQASVTVPAGVTFNVTNIGTSTNAAAQTISVQNIVLATATKQLAISLIANAASFTPPVAGATTWSAGDVSWSTPNGGPNSWVNGTRNNGTLSNAAYTLVATCNADASSCSTTGFQLTLGAKTTVRRSGSHTLTVTWKFEATGT